MAWPPAKHFETLVDNAKKSLSSVSITRYELGFSHAIIDLEGQWKDYRIIVSEIHRQDGSWRYAYYILDGENNIVHAFDNSPDISAVKLKYGLDWKSHFHEEIPHEHDSRGNIILSSSAFSLELFLRWISDNL